VIFALATGEIVPIKSENVFTFGLRFPSLNLLQKANFPFDWKKSKRLDFLSYYSVCTVCFAKRELFQTFGKVWIL